MNKREIPELLLADAEYRKLRNETRKAYYKLKKTESKFSFLDRIVQPRRTTDTKKDDVELEYAVMHLFESVGFKCTKPPIDGDVDVKVRFKNNYFGIEVKNGSMVSENDMLQPFKYKGLHGEDYHPIVIYNNARSNQNFDNNRIKLAIINNYGILLTSELRRGYIKLKNNKLSFQEFINQLNKSGEIKYSSKALGRSYKSEAPR